MSEINDLIGKDVSFKEVLEDIIEELKHKEVIVEQENGIIVKIKEIKGKGRHEINIDEIWYYAAFKELDEQLVRLISEWCVQQTRSGRYVLKV